LIHDPGIAEVTKNMKEAGWTVRVLVRYILLQVPGTALLVLILIQLRNWFDFPAWSVWGLVAISVAKDVILFPFVWSAYDWDSQREANSMVGRRGIVKERLAPSGYIKIRGELWKANVVGSSPPIEKGEAVRVEEMRGLTLLVRPYKEESNE
jgi:membrane protein implicated in regulation of membrane protease activity